MPRTQSTSTSNGASPAYRRTLHSCTTTPSDCTLAAMPLPYVHPLLTSIRLTEHQFLVPTTIINEKGVMPGASGDATHPKTAMNQITIQNLDLTSLNSTPNSYFFGVASKFRPLANGTDPGVTALNFSPRFSLKSASVDINATYAATLPVGGPQRLFFCTGSVAACTPPADLVKPIEAYVTSPKAITTEADEKRRLTKFLAGYTATGVIVMGTVLILIFVLGRGRRDKMRVLGGGTSEEKKGRIRGLAVGMGMVVGGAGVVGKKAPDYENWEVKRMSDGSEKGWNARMG